MSIRAIVVDDEPLARDELRFLLGQCEDIEVVGEARNAPEAQTLCEEEQPDVAFLDLRMPGPDGFGSAETMRTRRHDKALGIQRVLAAERDIDRLGHASPMAGKSM